MLFLELRRTSACMDRPHRLVTFVVPTFNERQNLPRLVESIRAHAPGPYEILVVDDASPDGTAELARDLAREHPVRVLSRPGKGGLGSAYRDGFREAKGDAVFEMDADLSHDPRFIPALLEAVERGADVAVGSRYVAGGRILGWERARAGFAPAGRARRDERLSVLFARRGGDRAGRAKRRIRVPGGGALPREASRIARRGSAHHVREPRGGQEQAGRGRVRALPPDARASPRPRAASDARTSGSDPLLIPRASVFVRRG